MKRHYIVGYDIADPRRLRRVAKIVEGFGVRVQYSFFHCCISTGQKKRLKSMVAKVIHEQEDQIMILPVTERQLSEVEFLGFKMNLQAEGIIII